MKFAQRLSCAVLLLLAGVFSLGGFVLVYINAADMPVSYTHLDVYKRQWLFCRWPASLSCSACSLALPGARSASANI